jgi:hypothetical protein
MTKPILFLDVDGVLNPEPVTSGRRPEGYQTHRMRPSGWVNPRVKPLKVWLNPAHGAALLSLPCALVWATAWEHEANEWIAPHIGLPKLPVVTFGTGDRPHPNMHWKTADLVRYTAGCPFAWLDDEMNVTYDGAYIRANTTASFKLVRVPPLKGLLDEHLSEIRTWAEGLDN